MRRVGLSAGAVIGARRAGHRGPGAGRRARLAAGVRRPGRLMPWASSAAGPLRTHRRPARGHPRPGRRGAGRQALPDPAGGDRLRARPSRMANVIAADSAVPALIFSHNKTLAAQLYGELKGFFPDHAVEYFISYYDYYQPEAFIPATGTYIEKDASINDEIERLRLRTTAACWRAGTSSSCAASRRSTASATRAPSRRASSTCGRRSGWTATTSCRGWWTPTTAATTRPRLRRLPRARRHRRRARRPRRTHPARGVLRRRDRAPGLDRAA